MRRAISFGLATLTIAACVGKIEPQVTSIDRAPPPAPSPSPSVPGRTPLPPSPPPSESPCPYEIALTTDDVDDDFGWKPARHDPGVCTEQDLTQFASNLVDPTIRKWTDLAKGLGSACASCVVTNDTDAQWGFVVVAASSNGDFGYFNWGACSAVLAGDACGKARQYEEHCLNAACNECTATRTERAECEQKARTGGMCTAFATERAAACPDAGPGCGTEFDAIRTLCGTKDEDAGM